MADLNSYYISNYTNDIWTNLITTSSKSLILSIGVTNDSDDPVICEIRITDSTGTEQFKLLPSIELPPHDGISNSDRIVLQKGYKIDVKASAPGVTFMVNLAENESI